MRTILIVPLLLTGCDSSDPVPQVDAAPDDAAPPDVDAAIFDAAGPNLAACSHFPTIADHFAYLNETRQGYEPHDRWRGIPWQGDYHTNVTFPQTFAWSDSLAAAAQVEAARVAAGGQPAGVHVPGQNGENRAMWIDGINTAAWRITARELPGDWTPPMFGHERAALHPSNGSARMGLFYHDFGGAGPVITSMGVGGAVTPACEVVWVLQMGG